MYYEYYEIDLKQVLFLTYINICSIYIQYKTHIKQIYTYHIIIYYIIYVVVNFPLILRSHKIFHFFLCLPYPNIPEFLFTSFSWLPFDNCYILKYLHYSSYKLQAFLTVSACPRRVKLVDWLWYVLRLTTLSITVNIITLQIMRTKLYTRSRFFGSDKALVFYLKFPSCDRISVQHVCPQNSISNL